MSSVLKVNKPVLLVDTSYKLTFVKDFSNNILLIQNNPYVKDSEHMNSSEFTWSYNQSK